MARYKDDFIFAREKKTHPMRMAVLLFVVILFVCVIAVNVISNGNVTLNKQSVTVPLLDSSYKILHITDLHGSVFGDRQTRLVAAWRENSYNAVCITGDMIGKDGDVQPFLDIADKLSKSVPVFFVPGDEDPEPILSVSHDNDTAYANWLLQLTDAGVIYLDSPYPVKSGKNTIWFVPLSAANLDISVLRDTLDTRMRSLLEEPESPERKAQITAVEYHMDRVTRISEARDQMREGDVFIVLTHHPLQEKLYSGENRLTVSGVAGRNYPVTLVLAGHYNGGQVTLPGIGPVRVPESSGLGSSGWFPDAKKVSGLYAIGGVPQYISAGLGNSSVYTFPVRIFNPPSVTMITLTPKLT